MKLDTKRESSYSNPLCIDIESSYE